MYAGAVQGVKLNLKSSKHPDGCLCKGTKALSFDGEVLLVFDGGGELKLRAKDEELEKAVAELEARFRRSNSGGHDHPPLRALLASCLSI